MFINFPKCVTRFHGKALMKTTLQLNVRIHLQPSGNAAHFHFSEIKYASSSLHIGISFFAHIVFAQIVFWTALLYYITICFMCFKSYSCRNCEDTGATEVDILFRLLAFLIHHILFIWSPSKYFIYMTRTIIMMLILIMTTIIIYY